MSVEKQKEAVDLNVYSYDEAVDLTGNGGYNYLALTACSIIAVACAMDMFGFGLIVTAATCDLRLGISEAAVLASVPFAGVLSAFPWGYFASTSGRRKALLLSTFGGSTFAALSSFSATWQVMLGLKLVGCFFSTASFNLAVTYLGECTGSLRRSRYLLYMNSANLGSETVFYILAYFILNLSFIVPMPFLSITYRPWRLYALVLASWLGLGTILLLFLRESPKYLANKGQSESALDVLRAMYVANGGQRDEYPVKMLSNVDVEDSVERTFWGSLVQQTVPLFRPPLLWRTLQLFYLTALCCSTNNVFAMWYPMMINPIFNALLGGGSLEQKIFCQRLVTNITTTVDAANYVCDDTISEKTIYSGMILGLILGFLGLAISGLATWRKLILIVSFIVTALCIILVNVLTDPIASMIVFTLVQMPGLGLGCVASYFVDLYPTSHRALATCLGMMVSRLLSFAGVNLVGAVIVDYCSTTFYGWTVYVCSGVAVALLLPADRKKT